MTLPDHMFVSSCDGALHDTRDENWSSTPLRPNYRRHHTTITSVADLKATLRAGRYTSLGSYPLFFIAADGAALSFEAVRDEFRECINGRSDYAIPGWCIVACDINYEDPDLYCAHSGDRIESAYADNANVESDHHPEDAGYTIL